jgi:hypothetical protein
MSLNRMGLGFVFTARDLASAKMAAVERRFVSLDERVTGGTARMTSSFQQLGIGLSVFTAGAASVAGALSLANAAGRVRPGRDAGFLRRNQSYEPLFSLPPFGAEHLDRFVGAPYCAGRAGGNLLEELDPGCHPCGFAGASARPTHGL